MNRWSPPPWQVFGNHPYVTYQVHTNPTGGIMIYMRCSRCNHQHQRLCNNVQLINHRVGSFAMAHAHGLRPRRLR